MTLGSARRSALLGALRIAFGVVFLVRPALVPRLLGLDTVTARRVAWLSRMVGAREVTLGGGLLSAALRGGDTRPWLLAAGASDALDAVGVTAACRAGAVSAVPAAATVLAGVAGAVAHGAEVARS